MGKSGTINCAECGMACRLGEHHPYAACLMFKACQDSKVVRENLKAVIRDALGLAEGEELFAEVTWRRRGGEVTFERTSIDQAPDWVQSAHERFHGVDASVDADNAKAADRACLAMIAQGFAWNGENWERPEGTRRSITVRDSVRGTARVSKVFPGDVIAEEYDTESSPQPPAEAQAVAPTDGSPFDMAMREYEAAAIKHGRGRDNARAVDAAADRVFALYNAKPPSAPVGVELLCRVYADAYHHGHHATVEGGYVDVLLVDRDTYWREKVEEDYAEELAQQPAAVDEAAVERVAALLHNEATDEPWTVAGVEHDGPDREYYRELARKAVALAAQHGDKK